MGNKDASYWIEAATGAASGGRILSADLSIGHPDRGRGVAGAIFRGAHGIDGDLLFVGRE